MIVQNAVINFKHDNEKQQLRLGILREPILWGIFHV